VSERIAGLLLFVPVPLVLWLFSYQPLGPMPSLAVGIALTLSHRLYARPFALKGAARRCLWCGGPAGEGPEFELREPVGGSRWRACDAAHLARVSRTLGWAAGHRRWLTVGILGTLAAFLLATGAAAVGWLPRAAGGDAVALLRIGIALTVLPLGWLGPARGRSEAAGLPLPFPVHIQALLGTLFVVWLFRLIGLWWLLAGLLRVVQRLA
jgi:hypothetical protein